jgi:hypothetical protein
MMRICDLEVCITGRIVRMARLLDEGYDFLVEPEAMVEGLRRSASRVDVFSFIQTVDERTPKYAYPIEWDNLAVLPVSTFDHWWTQQIRSLARNRAKQAGKKGVTIREIPFDGRLVKGIWEVYTESPVRQGKLNLHYGKTVEQIHQEAATFLDRSVFIGAFLGEQLIGFVKVTWDETRTQAQLMNIVSMIRHRDKAPSNALVAHAVRACADRRIPFLVYQKFSWGNKKQDGLSDFKANNGFIRVDIPRYYIPLTAIGHAAFRLRLHHRFADRVPEMLAARFRRLRRAWYNRVVPSSEVQAGTS